MTEKSNSKKKESTVEETKSLATLEQKATALAEWVKKETVAFEAHVQSVAKGLGLEIEVQTFLGIKDFSLKNKQEIEHEVQK